MDVPWSDRRGSVPCEQRRSRRGGAWPGYVEITEAYLTQLRAERKRTGVSPAALMRACPDKPPLLTSEMISNWMSRTTNTASEELMCFVSSLAASARPLRGRCKYKERKDGPEQWLRPASIVWTPVDDGHLRHYRSTTKKGLTRAITCSRPKRNEKSRARWDGPARSSRV